MWISTFTGKIDTKISSLLSNFVPQYSTPWGGCTKSDPLSIFFNQFWTAFDLTIFHKFISSQQIFQMIFFPNYHIWNYKLNHFKLFGINENTYNII